jgi:nucleoside-diphosphate-sugar epimerase
MIEHLNSTPIAPNRVVVMGAKGFAGGAIVARVVRDGIPVLALSRNEIDLLSAGAAERLGRLLRPDDVFVAVSALAPCKNSEMLVKNVIMARAMAQALAMCTVAQVVYISSDAVYADGPIPLSESSPAAPGTMHGAMHLAREIIFRSETTPPLAIMRPTLLYGARDPHNGYGPNRFMRQVARGEDIVLFGEGEERRDHLFIDDLAEVVAGVLLRRSKGVLNVATGKVHSFREIAEIVIKTSGKAVAVRGTPRNGPMPHNGYRPFDVSLCRAAFPQIRFTAIEEGLARTIHAERGGVGGSSDPRSARVGAQSLPAE